MKEHFEHSKRVASSLGLNFLFWILFLMPELLTWSGGDLNTFSLITSRSWCLASVNQRSGYSSSSNFVIKEFKSWSTLEVLRGEREWFIHTSILQNVLGTKIEPIMVKRWQWMRRSSRSRHFLWKYFLKAFMNFSNIKHYGGFVSAQLHL